MTDAMLWWTVAGLLVVAELITGTFYLLMLAAGLAAGALTAQAGGAVTTQIVVAAVAGGLGVAGVYALRRRRATAAPASSNRDVNLDIGQSLHVEHWTEDATARVQYRGAGWQVRLRGAQAGHPRPAPGTYVIRAVEGSELIVDR